MKKNFAVSVIVGALGGIIAYYIHKIIKKKQLSSSIVHKQGIYEKWLKRPQDFCCALLALIVLSPVILITAVLVRFKLGSPVIFKQERPGMNGNIFTLYKFRTMTDTRDVNGELLPDEERLTKFGKLLRSTSLDELPELWNIIKGDMSIVGPRPLIPEYLMYYTQEEKHRHDVRPGLTGLAQVNGRSFISWEEIFEYDLQYVSHITFIQDIKILLDTFKKVLERKNIADVSEARKDESGQLHYTIEGKDIMLHQPLNVERSL